MSIKPGIYKHYKGHEYEVMGIAKYESTLEDLVLYKPLYEQTFCDYWVRPISNFLEEVEWEGKKMPRFEFIKEKENKKMPQAGLGTFIIRENKILFGKRKNSHGSGQWGLTGGHLEFGESWEECAIREAMEETGLKLENVEYFAVTNDVMPEDNKHYLTIFMRTKYTGGEAQLLEPDKFEEWRWCTWDDLPTPLFKPLENLIKKGFNPFEK